MSEEHKKKLSEAAKRRKLSPEIAKQKSDKISKANKGRVAWNKGLANPNATKNLGKYAQKGLEGEKNPNWKGGEVKVGGYWYVYDKELGTQFSGGNYIKRANLIWFKEHGELISPPEFLHHLNNNREDDSIENLIKINLSKHSTHHFSELDRGCGGKVLKKGEIGVNAIIETITMDNKIKELREIKEFNRLSGDVKNKILKLLGNKRVVFSK